MESCVKSESTGAEGHCHGNHFWDTICCNWLFWLSLGYNFGCMIASDMLFDSRGWVFGVKQSDEDSQFRGSKGRCHGNHFLAFCICGAHWCHLANTTEPSVCSGDAALCQISLTTCFFWHL